MNTKLIRGTPINSKSSLIKTLCISELELDTFLSLSCCDRYKEPQSPVFKKDGTKRLVLCPTRATRKIQRQLNNNIFKDLVKWPAHLYGSIPKIKDNEELIIDRDYVNCAKMHCGAKSLLKVDIADFFNNISRYFVLELFKNCFGYNDSVSEMLTEICCYEDYLVQGALTSSYVASLIFYDNEQQVVDAFSRQKLIYTRLIDDITVSSKKSYFDFMHVERRITTMLMDKDLPINKEKTEIHYSSMEPLVVHGLRVEFSEPRLPAKEVSRLKAAVRNLEVLAGDKKYRKSQSYRKDFHRCIGRVNKLARVKHNQHEKLLSRIKKIKPYPSAVDIKMAYLIIAKLKVDHVKKKATYWYYKRYNQLMDRIYLIQNLYPDKAKSLKKSLKDVKPTYEFRIKKQPITK